MRATALAGLALCAAGLSACTTPRTTLSEDFGRALHEDLLAQIADPDATPVGPPPPSDGARAALAQERYRTGKVIKPTPATASKIGVVAAPTAGPTP
ncbi:hypothetical protein [Phenylobacterium soli]|uniref:DUF3035 domain-containing protein n=1 Tax=Phenylobacterium soli TaxID=2170551 RepID=A0A328AP87_9CAUL|nr:hypothetical protein [Phenylobacterium soli]RAK56131.1 hypothetical protein DJ017_17235 [Phenylobacterium soli]